MLIYETYPMDRKDSFMRHITSVLIVVLLVCNLMIVSPLVAYGATFNVNTPAPQTSNGITVTVTYSGSISGPGTVFEEGETVTITIELNGTVEASGMMYYRVFSPTVAFTDWSADLGGYLNVNAGDAISTTGWHTYTFTMPAADVTDMTLIWSLTEAPSDPATFIATPDVLPHTGGVSIVFVSGVGAYFMGTPFIEEVIVYDEATEVTRERLTATDPKSGISAVILPPNTSTTTDKVYTLQLFFSSYPSVNATMTVTVLKAPSVSSSYPIQQHFTDFTGSGTTSALIDATTGAAFVDLLFQGNVIDPANYTATTDPTTNVATITLSEAYLKTLSNGSYAFVATYSDGETEPISLLVNVATIPATGDSVLWVLFGAGSLVLLGCFALIVWKRKTKEERA